MQQKDIRRERSGEIISLDHPEYSNIAELITEAQKLIRKSIRGTAHRRGWELIRARSGGDG